MKTTLPAAFGARWSFVASAMLAGTLSLRAQTAPAAANNAKPAESVITLEEFRVEQRAESGYKPDHAFTATKTNTPLLDTPQSVSVIGEQLMLEQQVARLGEVLDNNASLMRSDRTFGAYEQFNSRGFLLGTSTGYLRNGRNYTQLHAVPIEAVERVEVLKGPASVLYGQGAPGGSINLITKRPTAKRSATARLTVGSYEDYRAQLDFGGPLAGDKLGYRLILAGQDSGSHRDSVYAHRQFAALAVSWAPLKQTRVLFNVDWQDDRRPWDSGTFALGTGVLASPINRVFTLPWSAYDSRVWNAGFNTQTTLGPNWTLYAGYNYQFYKRIRVDSTLGTPNATTGAVNNTTRLRINRAAIYTYNVDLTGKIEHGPFRHTLLLGANYTAFPISNVETQTNVVFPQNIFNPVYTALRPNYVLFPKRIFNRNEPVGFYAQDQIAIAEKFHLLLGARHDNYESYTYNENTGQTKNSVAHQKTDNLTPRAGFVFKPAPSVSLYGSYSESFEPNGLAAQGTNINQQLDPTLGVQYEGGVKADFLDRRLGVTAAVFSISRENAPYFDSVRNLTVQLGEQRHRGWEIEAFGRLTPEWSVTASFMSLDAEIVRDANPALAGRAPAGVPERTASGWTTYRFASRPLAGLSVSAGVRHESNRPGDNTGTFQLGSYTLLNAGLGYTFPASTGQTRALTLRLNVNNLLDERYYFGRQGRNAVNVGEPRVWKFSATYAF